MTIYSFCEQDSVGLLVIFAFQGVLLCFGLGDLIITDIFYMHTHAPLQPSYWKREIHKSNKWIPNHKER